jgi:spore germination cell wall hydrolase CwlJ-like protein
MRHLLFTGLLIAPAACIAPAVDMAHIVGAGRGLVNPPTVAQMTEVKCLATMVYGEARGERMAGQVAVAYSAVNRAQGKKSLCDVVLAPMQYSIFNNNPALRAAALSLHVQPAQKNIIDQNSWSQAMHVAYLVAEKKVADPTRGSTFYLAPAVMKQRGWAYPRWARQYKMVAAVDNHHFYVPHYPKNKITKPVP